MINNRRFENKYFVNNCEVVNDILSSYFLPDKEYPFNYIFTLHFDTFELDSYYDKVNGAYYKSKLRIRWYSDTDKHFVPKNVYIENKIKKNNVVIKYRKEVSLTDIQRKQTFNPIHWMEFIENCKPPLRIHFKKPMLPVMLSCYRRYRYYDPFSGSRLALDDNIRSLQVNECISPFNNVSPILKGGVLEVKGEEQYLPKCLANVGIFVRSSFSKYEMLLTKTRGYI